MTCCQKISLFMSSMKNSLILNVPSSNVETFFYSHNLPCYNWKTTKKFEFKSHLKYIRLMKFNHETSTEAPLYFITLTSSTCHLYSGISSGNPSRSRPNNPSFILLSGCHVPWFAKQSCCQAPWQNTVVMTSAYVTGDLRSQWRRLLKREEY